MGQSTTRYCNKDGVVTFHQQISGYGMQELGIIYEYFRSELIYIVETMGAKVLLRELSSRNVLVEQEYADMEKGLGHFRCSEKLVQDILEKGREAVMGFWECLYDLDIEHHHPNLYTLLDEIDKTGDTLMQLILLDEHGHSLTPELKDIQGLHKQHLLERTQNLVENRSPRPTQENESWHIPECNKDLIVVSIRPLHKQSQHWLIESGRKHEDSFQNEQSKLECISPNRLFRWSPRYKCVPRTVVVSGVPGVGKTTLMEKFVCDWVHGKLYQRFAFVFFFKFRELNRLGEVSLESMILQEYPHLQGHLQNILQDPEKLLFIFDGLDESVHQTNFTLRKLCKDIKQTENPGVIVVSLVKPSLLKGCSILITSRPTKLASVDNRYFRRVTEIMGLNPRERQMYCEQFFRDKELSENSFQYMRNNGALYNFCYIPSFCQVVCTVLSTCFKDRPTNNDQPTSPLPKTLTQLFVAFVANILSNHSLEKERAREQLTSIGRMAEHGVMKHIVTFNERDLASFNVDASSPLFSSFMKKSDQPPNIIFSFVHVTIQEFFAALVHYIIECSETLEKSFEEAKSYDRRGEIFLSFLCGLSDSYTRSMLDPYLGELSSQTAREVTAYLQNTFADVQDWKDDKRKLLSEFFYLFETQNKELVLESLGSHTSFDISQVHLTPLDCTVLSFILQSCRDTEALHIDHCNIHSESMERLAPVLHTIYNLRLCWNNLRDDGVRSICSVLNHPECKIQSLSLVANQLTDISCSHLGSAINNNQSLRTLDLSYNSLEGPKFSDLMTSLSSPTCLIEKLHLKNCHLTDTSCSPLASAITNNRSLRVLSLCSNDMTGPHFSDLVTALSSPSCCIEELLIQECVRGNEHLPLLVSLSNNTRLTKLELGGHRFSEADAGYIEELILRSPSLKYICIYPYHMVPRKIREQLRKLQDEKPGLRVIV